jgi:hypothetical protein
MTCTPVRLPDGTGDRWLCQVHRVPASRNVDYCPEHAPQPEAAHGGN